MQITLPSKLGFGYAKYIDLLELDANYRYPDIVRIYDFRTVNSNIDVDQLIKSELLFSPLLVAGLEVALKEGDWKVIGNRSLQDDEKIVPAFKLFEGKWFFVLGLDKFSRKVEANFESVKHLETLSATGASLLPTKIAMAFLRDEGKKIEDYFELSEYFEKVYYEEVTTIPAYYSMPKEMRGKPVVN